MWNGRRLQIIKSDTESFWQIGSCMISFDSLNEKRFMCTNTAQYCERGALERGEGVRQPGLWSSSQVQFSGIFGDQFLELKKAFSTNFHLLD